MYDLVKFLYSIICLNTSHESKIITHFAQEKEKFIADNDVKQLFTVHNLQGEFVGSLRPEITYLSLQTCNKFKDAYFYIGACFRNERKQFLRFKEFVQLGIERISANQDVHLYNFLMIITIKKILLDKLFSKKNIIIHLIYSESNVFSQLMESVFEKYKIATNQNTRIGDINQYNTISFEAEHIAESKNIEILGGGIYSHKGSYGVGFAAGLERLLYFIKPQEQQQIIENFVIKQLSNKSTATIYINYREQDYKNLEYLIKLSCDIERLIDSGYCIKFNTAKEKQRESGYKIFIEDK